MGKGITLQTELDIKDLAISEKHDRIYCDRKGRRKKSWEVHTRANLIQLFSNDPTEMFISATTDK